MSLGERGLALKVEKLSFTYRHKRSSGPGTLKDINFDVPRGETLGVVGRNCAGKSTLLRLLAGVLAPSGGVIYRAPGVRCGLLSLGVGFMADLTGADNVVISLMLQGLSQAEARQKLQEIQSFAELGDAFYDRVKTYSSGMRARLTFSTALFADADVLLIDEVLAVGDGEFRNKAKAALSKRILGEQTVVYVAHSQSAVRDLCDRVLWIEDGQTRMLGSSREVLTAYQSEFKKF